MVPASRTTATMVILVLPGRGVSDLGATCAKLAVRHPNTPAVVFHTPESERTHPAIDYHVFELLPVVDRQSE